MSGGVDSSLAAALLLEAGHEVFGVFMRMVGEDAPPPFVPSDPAPARQVADHLGIPLHVLDCPEALDALVAYFCSEYDAGRTPNPCVVCNKWNKFGRLLVAARRLGAERLATGHYARLAFGALRATGPGKGGEETENIECRTPNIEYRSEVRESKELCHRGSSARTSSFDIRCSMFDILASQPAFPSPVERWLLLRARHRPKDQSYMLCGLDQAQLSRALFPLGELSKEEVRRMARERGLPVHQREESQDLCFLPDRNYAALLRRCIGDRIVPGPILDTRGRVLGTHPGCQCFTIGQRRGLGVAAGSPRYVVRIDRAANAVVIGTREELRRESMLVSQVNWIAFDAPPAPFEASVQIRYNHEPAPARVEPLPDGGARVVFRSPESGITPGQAAVFYEGDLVLGGGWIEPG